MRVVLPREGESILGRLAGLHRDERERMGDVLTLPIWRDG